MLKRALSIVFAAAALALAWPAAAQVGGVPYFPQNLPPSTVAGRLPGTAGPVEAIPFATLQANLLSGSSWPVSQGGTNCTAPSGTCLDNITGFAATGYLQRTGAGTYAFGAITAFNPPGGRLTAQSGVPIQTAEEVNVSTIYYPPYPGRGNQIVIGGVAYTFTTSLSDTVGQSLTLGNYVTAGNIYDVFDIVVAGAPQLCVGPAWSTAPTIGTTPGVRSAAGAIGIDNNYSGLLVNTAAAAMACTYGAGAGATVNVAQYQATQLGMIYGSGTGTVTVQLQPASVVGGSNPYLGMCNTYNQEPVTVFEEDSTAQYTLNSGVSYTFANLNYNNSITFLQCPNPKKITAVVNVSTAWDAAGGNQAVTIGIGYDVASNGPTFTGAAGGGAWLGQWAGTAGGQGAMLFGGYSTTPTQGLHRVSDVEQGTANATFLNYHDFGSLQLKGFF